MKHDDKVTLLQDEIEVLKERILELEAENKKHIDNKQRELLPIFLDSTAKLDSDEKKLTREIIGKFEAEEALRLSGELFSKAFNCSPQIISVSKVADGRYLLLNDSFYQITGNSLEESIGKTAMELGIWADLEERKCLSEIILKDGRVRDFQLKFKTKSGEIRLGLYSAELVKIGDELCMIGTTIDITDHRRMEKEIARIDQMNLVGAIAASIGHEIRNPMTSVRGFLQLLSNKEEYIQDQEFFQLMIEELDRANAIITEFLSLAKNKAVDLRLHDLNSIINNICPLIQAQALVEDKYIKLDLGEIPGLMIDENEIRQLIYNLIMNGLEAMHTGGTVTIKTFMLGRQVVLSVQDQGKGISPDIMEQLGVPFITKKENGIGLGLSTCFSIAARHNAQIDIDTNGDGTTFFIRFKI